VSVSDLVPFKLLTDFGRSDCSESYEPPHLSH